jgi:hypothetical protein
MRSSRLRTSRCQRCSIARLDQPGIVPCDMVFQDYSGPRSSAAASEVNQRSGLGRSEYGRSAISCSIEASQSQRQVCRPVPLSIPNWSYPTTWRRTPCDRSHWVAKTGSIWAASKPAPRSPPSSPPSNPAGGSTSRSEIISLTCCLGWLTYPPCKSTNLHLPHGKLPSSSTPPLGCSDAYGDRSNHRGNGQEH